MELTNPTGPQPTIMPRQWYDQACAELGKADVDEHMRLNNIFIADTQQELDMPLEIQTPRNRAERRKTAALARRLKK